MKTKYFIVGTMIAITTIFAFTACEKDKEPETNPIEEIGGTYSGNMNIAASLVFNAKLSNGYLYDFTEAANDTTLTNVEWEIIAKDNNTVLITVKDTLQKLSLYLYENEEGNYDSISNPPLLSINKATFAFEATGVKKEANNKVSFYCSAQKNNVINEILNFPFQSGGGSYNLSNKQVSINGLYAFDTETINSGYGYEYYYSYLIELSLQGTKVER